MPLSRCSWHNCPNLVPRGTRYCKTHQQAHEAQRGTASQRGYDIRHQAERARWVRYLAQGHTITCAKCGRPITSHDTWDLGHTQDRTTWTGPEHAHCNRSAGQANSMRMREHWTRQH